MNADDLSHLDTDLAAQGLTRLGHCATLPEDNIGDGTLFLIGPDEPAFWPLFSQSTEYKDGQPEPLDRWSRHTLNTLASQHNAAALFPFGGAPYLPFFTWALRTGRFWSSPIGFLVHDQAGLFASFRGALLLPGHMAATPAQKPCDTCASKPCKSACPVGAFADGYDVDACKTHLAAPAGTDCMETGCRARRACPVHQGNRLPAQAAFHMKAFL